MVTSHRRFFNTPLTNDGATCHRRMNAVDFISTSPTAPAAQLGENQDSLGFPQGPPAEYEAGLSAGQGKHGCRRGSAFLNAVQDLSDYKEDEYRVAGD